MIADEDEEVEDSCGGQLCGRVGDILVE